jgi:hypothetical protein
VIRVLRWDLLDEISIEKNNSGSGNNCLIERLGIEEIFVDRGLARVWPDLDQLHGAPGVEDAGGDRSLIAFPPDE